MAMGTFIVIRENKGERLNIMGNRHTFVINNGSGLSGEDEMN